MTDSDMYKSVVTRQVVSVNMAHELAGSVKIVRDTNPGLEPIDLREQKHGFVLFETTLFRGLVVDGRKNKCHC